MEMDIAKVVVLGARGVGKTSVITRFVLNEFSEEHTTTVKRDTFHPSVIIDEHIYELKITDVPVITYFPNNTFCEWADYRYYGLRTATAYILVFDLSNVETFQFIRTMREQMMERRDMKHVPIVIVGNKQDQVQDNGACSDLQHRKRRDIVTLVRKHWKCSYVECSAKHNWGVVAVFKEVMEAIHSLDPKRCNVTSGDREYAPMGNINDGLDDNKCIIS